MILLLYIIAGLIAGFIAVKMDHPHQKITKGRLFIALFIALFGFVSLAIVIFIGIVIGVIEISERLDRNNF